MRLRTVILAAALLSHPADARADETKEGITKLVGGIAGFGVMYGVTLPLATSDDRAFKGRPLAIPVAGPLVVGLQFMTTKSDWAPLTTFVGGMLVADALGQAACLVLAASGVIDLSKPSKVRLTPTSLTVVGF